MDAIEHAAELEKVGKLSEAADIYEREGLDMLAQCAREEAGKRLGHNWAASVSSTENSRARRMKYRRNQRILDFVSGMVFVVIAFILAAPLIAMIVNYFAQ